MRLSTDMTVLWQRYGHEKAIEIIKRAGFDAVDYCYWKMWNNTPAMSEEYEEYARTLRGYLDAAGLPCNQIHIPWPLAYGEKMDESEFHFAASARSILAAGILGAKVAVVHAVKIPEGEPVSVVDYNYEYMMALLPYAKRAGVRIGIENLFRRDPATNTFYSHLGTPAEILSLLEKLPREHFGICIDVGHAALTYGDPAKFIREVGRDKIIALHVHDVAKDEDSHQLPFLRTLNFEDITTALREVGYDGDFTYEIEGYYQCFPEGMEEAAYAFSHRTGRHLIGMLEGGK